MRDISCPINSNKRTRRLVPQQSQGLGNQWQPRWNINEEQNGHYEVQHPERRSPSSSPGAEVSVRYQEIDGGDYDRDNGDDQWGDSPEHPFEVCRVSEIPTDAMEAAEDDAEKCEDKHAGIPIAGRGWCIKRWDVRSTGLDIASGNDTEDGGKYEGN